MNKLLSRQLKRNQIDYTELPENFKKLCDEISKTYDHHELDRTLIERSIEISSQELIEANFKLRQDAEKQKIVFENLKTAITSLPLEEGNSASIDSNKDFDLIMASDILMAQIQKRKDAEAKLKLYERAIFSSSNGIIITDPTLPDNPMVFANPAFYKITGYTPEELIGKNCRILQGDDKEQPGIIELRQAIKEKKACTIKVKNFKKDGSLFWNELTVSPIFSSDGKVTNYIGVQSDITDRILADQLLQKSNARLMELIKNLGSGILVENENREIALVNDQFCKMFSIPVSADKLVGVDCSQSAEQSKDMFDNPDEFVISIEELLKNKTLALNQELKLTDGRVFERDYVPIYVDDKYKGHLWNYRDITDRKNSENKLFQERQLLKTIIDNIPHPIYVKDRYGKKILVNKAEINVLGVESENQVVGKDDFDLYPKEIAYKTKKEEEKIFEQGIPILNEEGFIINSKGNKEWFIGNKIPLKDSTGGILGLVGISLNITSRKQIEEALRESKAKYEAVVNSINQVIFQIDGRARWVFLNSAWTKITGYSVEESLGRNMMEFIHEGNKKKNFQFFRPLMKREIEYYRSELRCITKDGNSKWIEVTGRLIIDENKRIVGASGTITDIDERKKVEDQIKSIAKFPIENPNPILRTTLDGKVIFSNPSSKELLALLSINVGDYLPKQIQALAEEAKVLQKHKIFEVKIEDRYYSMTFVPILDFNYLNIYAINISLRKKAEQEVVELKAFYETTLDDLSGQVAVFDSSFKYLYVNTQSVVDHEIRKWLIGKDDFEYCEYRGVDNRVAEIRRQKLLEAKSLNKTIRFEETFMGRDGKLKFFERKITPIFDKNHNIDRYIAYGIDITEIKNVETDLLRIKNQLESVLNTVGEGIITIDQNGTIVLVNNEIENIFGWSRAELLNQNISILMPKSYRSAHAAGMERYISKRETKILGKLITIEGLKKNNSVFPMQIRIEETIIGEQLLFTAAINDITELNRLIKDLEASNKSLSDFAYIASHDLREPLRKISSFGSLLSKSLSGKLEDDDQENLDFMIEGAKRMQQMVDDLLFYSRITAKAKKYSNVDLDDTISEIINFDLAESISENNAKIMISQQLGSYKGERTQLKQLLQNLVGNAIKYRKKETDPIIIIRSERLANILQIEIEDNGIGINDKYINQIFEMFKRLHSKDSYGGSGIGLAVCKKIIELYDGEIEVKSELGKGSTFIIKLPLN